MYMRPFNRHLLIELVTETENKPSPFKVLLPEDYQKKVDKFAVAEVVEISEDCSLNLLEGDFVVVARAMIEKVKLKDETFSLILENYVYGFIEGGSNEENGLSDE